MNQNFMKSSFKAVAAALVASLAFTSCSKDQFTEKDALNLELSRLRAQRSIDSIKTLQDRTDRNALLRYQRTLDSLDRENAGGRVFYTVNVISATASAVAGGRTEESEGVTGAVVTTSQYGRVVSATTQAGIATFELRSGEATVAVTAPLHTSADYTVNLTAPFSGGQIGNTGIGGAQTAAPVTAAKNGTTVYVGNVLPLFEISTDGAEMATIRGRAFIETDLTNDVEELANTQNAAIQAAGTVANIFVSAGINSNNATFFTRYLAKNGSQYTTAGNNLGGTSGVAGAGAAAGIGVITKLFYGPATPATGSGSAGAPVNRVAVGATGDYTILVPATVSGLPIVIKSDEIVANRTYFRSDDLGFGQVTTQRFMYGPQVTADRVDLAASQPRVSFQAFTTPATVTASYTPQVAASSFATGTTLVTQAGLYGVLPSVTVALGTAGGTAPTGVATTAPYAATGNVIHGSNGINITAGGTGVAATAGAANDAVFSLTRNDLITIGSGNKVLSVGGSIGDYIQVTDGGFGFNYPTPATYVNTAANGFNLGFAAATVGGTGVFTGFLPAVNFTVLPGETAPTGRAIPDLTTGTIAATERTSPGSNLSSIPSVLPTVLSNTSTGFVFGPNTSNVLPDAANAPVTAAVTNLIVAGAVAGTPQFNTSNATAPVVRGATTLAAANASAYQLSNALVSTVVGSGDITIAQNTLTANTLAGAQALTGIGNYVFTPSVALVGRSTTGATLTGGPATTSVVVSTSNGGTIAGGLDGVGVANGAAVPIPAGLVRSINVAFGAGYNTVTFPAGVNTIGALPAGITSIGLSFTTVTAPTGATRTTNTLSANIFSSGTGLDNYVVTTQPFGGTLGAGQSALAPAVTSLIGVTTASSATFADANNTPMTNTLASNLLAGSAWLAVFDVPTAAPRIAAWGVPIFATGNTLTGVRIVRGGAGYPNNSANIRMRLIPNPFRGLVAGLANGTAPTLAQLTGTPAVFSATASPVLPTAGTPAWFDASFNAGIGVDLANALTNGSPIGIELPTTASFLTFTVTNGGSGYAQAPDVVIADGGITFGDIANLLGGPTTAVGPVVMTGTATVAAGGSLLRVGNTFTGGTPSQGRVTFRTLADPAGVDNNFVFKANPAVFVIDRLSNALTTAYNAAPNTAGNPYITIGAGGSVIGLGSEQTFANNTAQQLSKLTEAFVTSAAWPAVAYHSTPTVTIAAPATGTAATAVIDPAGVETATFVPGIRLTPNLGLAAAGAATTTRTYAVTGGGAAANIVFTNTNANTVFTTTAGTPVRTVGAAGEAVWTLPVAAGATVTVTEANTTNTASTVTTPAGANTVAAVPSLSTVDLRLTAGAAVTAGAVTFDLTDPTGFALASTPTVSVIGTTAGLTAPTLTTLKIGTTTRITATFVAAAGATTNDFTIIRISYTGATAAVAAAGTTITNTTGGTIVTPAAAAYTLNANVAAVAAGTPAVVTFNLSSVASVTPARAVTGDLGGKIQAIRVTSGGSGYGRGNLFQRFFTNSGTGTGGTTIASVVAGQAYEIIGSNLSGTGTTGTNGNVIGGSSPQLGVTGSQFDVMTGVTYVRDIHYGTGRRID